MARLLGLAPFAACQRNIRRVYDRSPDDALCERGFRGKFATDWTKLHPPRGRHEIERKGP